MPDISIIQVSKDFNYAISTLRVYHTDRRLPMVKKYRRLFVTEETYKNLQSLHKDGIPFARYFEVYRKQQSGLGGESNDYQTPEYLVLTKPDKGSQAALIAELQETTAEQERELERQEKRLKNYTLEILELKNRIKALEHQLDTTKWEAANVGDIIEIGMEVVQQVVAVREEKERKEITPEALEEAIREANRIRTTIR